MQPKTKLTRQPTLFELEKPSEPATLNIERHFSLPGIFLGTELSAS
jgi:hypothetical protein